MARSGIWHNYVCEGETRESSLPRLRFAIATELRKMFPLTYRLRFPHFLVSTCGSSSLPSSGPKKTEVYPLTFSWFLISDQSLRGKLEEEGHKKCVTGHDFRF